MTVWGGVEVFPSLYSLFSTPVDDAALDPDPFPHTVCVCVLLSLCACVSLCVSVTPYTLHPSLYTRFMCSATLSPFPDCAQCMTG